MQNREMRYFDINSTSFKFSSIFLLVQGDYKYMATATKD